MKVTVSCGRRPIVPFSEDENCQPSVLLIRNTQPSFGAPLDQACTAFANPLTTSVPVARLPSMVASAAATASTPLACTPSLLKDDVQTVFSSQLCSIRCRVIVPAGLVLLLL